MRALAVILLATLAASCGGRPGVNVSVGGTPVPIVRSSTMTSTACSSEIGDAFPQDIPLTTVRSSGAISLRFDAGQGTTAIRGWISDADAPTSSGGPIEEFTLPGQTGTYEPRAIAVGRTYLVGVNIVWSMLVTHGEESHLFRLRIEPP